MPGQLGGAPLCLVCNTRAYFNDQKTYKENVWHKKCFRCAGCKKELDTSNANLTDDLTLVCNGCLRKITKQMEAAEAGPKVTTEHVDVCDPECCPRCGKRVYFAEQMLSLGRKWHKTCFTCCQCNKKVDSQSASDHEGELYCRSCYGREFGPKGYGFAGGAGTMMSGDSGNARRSSDTNSDGGSRHSSVSSQASREEYVNVEDEACCPRCGKRVYFAEQVLSLGRKWHKPCFRCVTCDKKLDSQSTADHQGEVYCRSCHSRQFGLKGYGYASGAGTMLSMDTGHHKRGERESSSSSGDDRRLSTQTSRDEYVNVEDEACCPRCGKRVYFAEQVLSLGRKWHKPCFRCEACGKKVDSQSAADHQGELYCQSCHGRKFGPKGYGFAGGAGTMLSMDTGDPNTVTTDNVPGIAQAYVAPTNNLRQLSLNDDDEDDGAQPQGTEGGCPRCGTQVFLAEQRVAAGNSYHARCFTCFSCSHKLDSNNLTEKDSEIYCQNCYGKKFAPQGYGFGTGAGILQTNTT